MYIARLFRVDSQYQFCIFLFFRLQKCHFISHTFYISMHFVGGPCIWWNFYLYNGRRWCLFIFYIMSDSIWITRVFCFISACLSFDAFSCSNSSDSVFSNSHFRVNATKKNVKGKQQQIFGLIRSHFLILINMNIRFAATVIVTISFLCVSPTAIHYYYFCAMPWYHDCYSCRLLK